MRVTFEDWTQGRPVLSLGTNAGAPELPFQRWRNFKEAFAPELVARAIRESTIPVRRCADPFGGSGTTALACQFLGVEPVTVEVNPFLADLIEAKLASYDVDMLRRDFVALIKAANRKRPNIETFFAGAPPTFVEPGIAQRWIFDYDVAARVAAIVNSLATVENDTNRRLLRVLLGGVLTDVSNVTVSGKGRRYRAGWNTRGRRSAADLDEAFRMAAQKAVGDILRHANRRERRYSILRGDARALAQKLPSSDIAVFSPPYPNSSDYTDVYNLELWTLGYLTNSATNSQLRHSTMSSHVQIKRDFPDPPSGSQLLTRTVRRLESARPSLWNPHIPAMVGAYFTDMLKVLRAVSAKMPRHAQLWLVVGDSRYSGVEVHVAEILAQLASQITCKVLFKEPCRSMRASAQQGRTALSETLLVLART